MKIYTGGPALPVFSEQADDRKSTSGMTLRDYFAAKAMEADLSEGGIPMRENFKKVLANHAYKMADAMLEARK
jgi:hypothetical protein